MAGDSDDRNWGKFASSGMELAVGIGLGAAAGAWIDKERHASNPWGLLFGCCVGFASGMYLLIKSAMKSNRD
jgi:F0F1-type ATP synthase assembly protein I